MRIEYSFYLHYYVLFVYEYCFFVDLKGDIDKTVIRCGSVSVMICGNNHLLQGVAKSILLINGYSHPINLDLC